tara:strand:+ start:393 stop:734 length:342 start_codon:yes stop_codon:yes gene_type:complete
MSFEENIKQWILVDNEMKKYYEKIKSLREKKNNIQENIIVHVKQNDLDDATVKINDGKLKFVETKTSNPITLKYLQSCLEECIESENDVQHIMNYIKDNRETKQHSEIKRFYD